MSSSMNPKKMSTPIRCAKVVGIQFSLLSPEEIRKSSVAEITNRDTYKNNRPEIGGLFDPRMGVLEPGLLCPTDGHDYLHTPGYNGHMELARPVFYIQYLGTITKLLKCVCFECSKLLIHKDRHQQAQKMSADMRWKYLHSIASKVKRCGELTDDGCGCLQPNKIREVDIATIKAEWSNGSPTQPEEEKIVITVTPEMVIKIFKRISDDDVSFLGFNPIFSRPEWMVCQVMLVPPPAMRPSVKHDSQQRSEDDLTHILVNIFKTNKTLQEKIRNNAPSYVIDDLTKVLQYFVASQVDNKFPGADPVMQRSGRPLKSIKDRLNGKSGRMRANLMAKRVDFSARSVITADPNISIRELGVPLRIAKNITKPVTVNARNRAFLTKLVANGPDIFPGAKILQKKSGENITLRYFTERKNVYLQDGDIVHRHMMDGDPILFNRQPTLHRMSMMCHIARIMMKGDTFRMNVGTTKPYNADFDGDEMNLHMPQDAESDAELRHLAAVPYNIVSPANNSPIIGIYQDSMLGCYLFSRSGLHFSPSKAMNLLAMFHNVDEYALLEKTKENGISNFDILTQIMPPLSIYYKTDAFKEETDHADTSNAILEIVNGRYLRGQMDKHVLGKANKGLILRTCNDFGNMAAAKFIDDLQNVVTEYMKSAGFSVGVSDLISDNRTKEEVVKIITSKKRDVKTIMERIHLGLFENNTGKSNVDEFETQVNNILNQALRDSEKVCLKSLGKDNRFVTMVNAGSKGSHLNISSMIACLGQQNVDGKRIPYGFENRTLPHFTKFDDSPEARGFVQSSYIHGLTPQELFFHAMGGRVGLIDTAVKTSTTGYIQRRLIKGLEDLMVSYDMTIRSNKNKIVQFAYGDDGIDTTKVESQQLPLVTMTIQEIYDHYAIAEQKKVYFLFADKAKRRFASPPNVAKFKDAMAKLIDYMIAKRNEVVEKVFKNKNVSNVSCPVAFSAIIANVRGQMNLSGSSTVDITPLEAYDMIRESFEDLYKIHYAPPTELFKVMYFFYLSPKDLVIHKRFNHAALTFLLQTIRLAYKRSIVSPGEMVGIIAGQSIGEVSTQMTLNTFHFAGVASKSNVTRGVPRIEEILTLSDNPKNPSLTVFLKQEDEQDKEKARSIMYMLEHTKLEEIVKSVEICFDPNDSNTLVEEDADLIAQYRAFQSTFFSGMETEDTQETLERSKWLLRMELDPEIMLEKNITMDDVNFTLNSCYGEDIFCMYSDYNADKLIFRIRMQSVLCSSKKTAKKPLDQADQVYTLKKFQEQMLENVVLRGIKGLNKVNLRKVKDNLVEIDGAFKPRDIWVLDTVGTNLLDVLGLDYVDYKRTYSNDIVEIFDVLGIEAARLTISNELGEVMEFDGAYINWHNFSVLVDRMTYTDKKMKQKNKMISIFRHGINNDDIGPIAKASFEETPEMFLRAARHAELDTMRGISANVMCGQQGYYGTSAFQVILDVERMTALSSQVLETVVEEEGTPGEEDMEEEKVEDVQENITLSLSVDTASRPESILRNYVATIQPESINLEEIDNGYNPGF